MRILPKPTMDAEGVFRCCISGTQNADLHARLDSVISFVTKAAGDYDTAATAAMLFEIAPSTTVGGLVTAVEMTNLYKSRFAKKDSPGRSIYDRILMSASNEICPLCGAGRATTLDHHLPKANHPALAVVPSNLVPCCRDCNAIKLSRAPSSASDQTLHPYYDALGGMRWISAEILHTTPPTFRYRAAPPEDWSPVDRCRVRTHFDAFQLARRYGVLAADEMTGRRAVFESLMTRGGAPAVRAHFQEQAEGLGKAWGNSWQAAMYRAAADDTWFCGGGYRA